MTEMDVNMIALERHSWYDSFMEKERKQLK